MYCTVCLIFTFVPRFPYPPFCPLSPGIPCINTSDDVDVCMNRYYAMFISELNIMLLKKNWYTFGPIGPGGPCVPFGPVLPCEMQ